MEYELLIEGLMSTYEGIFDIKKLRSAIEGWAEKRNYVLDEKLNDERVSEKGKNIQLKYNLKKELGRFVTSYMQLGVEVKNMAEVEAEFDRKKAALNKGKVDFVINCWLETWYEGRWEQASPFYYFITEMVNKFVYQFRAHTGAGKEQAAAKKDCYDLMKYLKAHMNLYRYQAKVTEQIKA